MLYFMINLNFTKFTKIVSEIGFVNVTIIVKSERNFFHQIFLLFQNLLRNNVHTNIEATNKIDIKSNLDIFAIKGCPAVSCGAQ